MRFVSHLVCLVILLSSLAADWPTWRHDANRSAASPQTLPKKLSLQWSRQLPPQKTAWPDQSLMTFDAAYQPIVAGQLLFVTSTRDDSLTAFDARSGKERWKFFAGGPIRFAPTAWKGNVYFGSDDGYVYCLEAKTGELLWKFRGGPGDRFVLGNERLISTWPVRGAPVISTDGKLYFAASIWPFMGIFLHALDAETGEVLWTNDADGSSFMKQPHNTDSFAGVAPQGPLAVIGEMLLISGGRSVPACYDRQTGKLIHYLLNENSKKGGGSEVAAIGKIFINGGAAFTLDKGKYLGAFATQPVLTTDTIYAFQKDAVRTFDLRQAEILPPKWKIPEVDSFSAKGGTALIKAGNQLIVGQPNKVFAVNLPLGKQWSAAWEQKLEGTPAALVAADDRLFVTTLDGKLLCFGGTTVSKPATYPLVQQPAQQLALPPSGEELLQVLPAREGYAICWGVGDGKLLQAVAQRTKLHIIAIEKDAGKVQEVRTLLAANRFYGDRIAILQADPQEVQLPPYLAVAMFTADPNALAPLSPQRLQKVIQPLRPFGGKALLELTTDDLSASEELLKTKLTAGKIAAHPRGIILQRAGPLPDTDNWTHEHADPQNTRVSTDALVKAPLGLLWFGGPSNDGVLPRHGHGPQPQVIDGRIIIEGVDKLRAIDIYTGRLLWETSLPGVGAFFDNTAHQPGANASGTNFISTHDTIYVAYRNGCVLLDPETGKKVREFKLPSDPKQKTLPRWGYINVIDDYLIGGSDPLWDPAYDMKKIKPANPLASDDDLKSKLASVLPALKMTENDNLSASKHLVVMHRKTGEILWSTTARFAFRHNGICAGNGKLFAIDRLSSMQIKRLTRDKQLPHELPRVVAFDLKTGSQLWQQQDDVFGTWLSYSEKHDVLVESGRVARDTLYDEPKGMRGRQGANGVALWHNKTYLGPAMIHGDSILKDTSACELLTGKPKMRPDPLTGEPVEWTWVRNYGCNTPMASQNLMTFRSGAAGYLDLCNDGGTGNFGGFRSSCTNNLVVAGGVLCAPEYTRTCTCSYQNQSSVGLVYAPETEMWTSFGKVGGKGAIKQVGLNFGAPGDRRAADGMLWLEYPSTGGLSPSVTLKVIGEKTTYFRHHPSRVAGPLNWIVTSGISGADELILTLEHAEQPTERVYTVRFYFAEPEAIGEGERLFDLTLQGEAVLQDFDIVKEAGGANRSLVKEFTGIKAAETITLKFTSKSDKPPILAGWELKEEKAK